MPPWLSGIPLGYKDTRVPKLLDYNELAPQYVTYRIYRYFGENAREPLAVLDASPESRYTT